MAKKQTKKTIEPKIEEEKTEEVIQEEVKTSFHANRDFFWSGKTYKKGEKVELDKKSIDLLLSKKIIE